MSVIVNADGSLSFNSGDITAGRWSLDQKGVHAQFEIAGLPFQLDVLNEALATPKWTTVTRATMTLQATNLHQSTSRILDIA